jgi:hypothetical protein
MSQDSWGKLGPDSDHDGSVGLLNPRPHSLRLQSLKRPTQATIVFLGAVLLCIAILFAISLLYRPTNLDQLCTEHTSQYC